MAEDEKRRGCWLGGQRDGGDERGDVGQDLGGRAGQSTVCGLADGPAPSALVEAIDGDAGGSEGGEKAVVAANVVAEAVKEDKFGDGGGVVVRLGGRGTVSIWMSGSESSEGRLTSHVLAKRSISPGLKVLSISLTILTVHPTIVSLVAVCGCGDKMKWSMIFDFASGPGCVVKKFKYDISNE